MVTFNVVVMVYLVVAHFPAVPVVPMLAVIVLITHHAPAFAVHPVRPILWLTLFIAVLMVVTFVLIVVVFSLFIPAVGVSIRPMARADVIGRAGTGIADTSASAVTGTDHVGRAWSGGAY